MEPQWPRKWIGFVPFLTVLSRCNEGMRGILMVGTVKRLWRRGWALRKSLVCIGIACAYFFTDVVSIYAAEANFWSDRRHSRQKFQDRNSLAKNLPKLGLAAENPPSRGLSD